MAQSPEDTGLSQIRTDLNPPRDPTHSSPGPWRHHVYRGQLALVSELSDPALFWSFSSCMNRTTPTPIPGSDKRRACRSGLAPVGSTERDVKGGVMIQGRGQAQSKKHWERPRPTPGVRRETWETQQDLDGWFRPLGVENRCVKNIYIYAHTLLYSGWTLVW